MALRQRLALLIRLALLGVRPVGLGKDLSRALFVTGRDGGNGRRDHDTLHRAVRLRTRTEDALGAVHRRTNELIFVIGRRGRKRRGHMQHMAAAGNRLVPAGIAHQIGFDELEPAGAIAES